MWPFTEPAFQSMSWAWTSRGRPCASTLAREYATGQGRGQGATRHLPLDLACSVLNHSLSLYSSSAHRQLQFSPEEVLGMVLNYSRSLAEDFAGEPRWQDGDTYQWLRVLVHWVGLVDGGLGTEHTSSHRGTPGVHGSSMGALWPCTLQSSPSRTL